MKRNHFPTILVILAANCIFAGCGSRGSSALNHSAVSSSPKVGGNADVPPQASLPASEGSGATPRQTPPSPLENQSNNASALASFTYQPVFTPGDRFDDGGHYGFVLNEDGRGGHIIAKPGGYFRISSRENKIWLQESSSPRGPWTNEQTLLADERLSRSVWTANLNGAGDQLVVTVRQTHSGERSAAIYLVDLKDGQIKFNFNFARWFADLAASFDPTSNDIFYVYSRSYHSVMTIGDHRFDPRVFMAKTYNGQTGSKDLPGISQLIFSSMQENRDLFPETVTDTCSELIFVPGVVDGGLFAVHVSCASGGGYGGTRDGLLFQIDLAQDTAQLLGRKKLGEREPMQKLITEGSFLTLYLTKTEDQFGREMWHPLGGYNDGRGWLYVFEENRNNRIFSLEITLNSFVISLNQAELETERGKNILEFIRSRATAARGTQRFCGFHVTIDRRFSFSDPTFSPIEFTDNACVPSPPAPSPRTVRRR